MYDFKLSDPHFLPHAGIEVCLSLIPGELNVLSGENGIGKSTLLQKIVDGSSQYSVSLADQRPMDVFFNRKLKIFKDILLSGSGKLRKEFLEKYWKLSGLSLKEDRFLSQLSGGEAQILKIISVCSADADIYLLDEPGQYLDPEKKILVNRLLEDLSTAGKSVLVVEHDAGWLRKTNSLCMAMKGNLLQVHKL